MNRVTNAIVCAGFICAGAQAFGDDSMPSDSSSQASNHQMMKDCMTKHATNDGMSKGDAKKACNSEMNMGKNHTGAKVPTDSPTDDKNIGTGETSNK
jgi:hypothetical protein